MIFQKKYVQLLALLATLILASSCSKDQVLHNEPGNGVTDIDGNFYPTTVIGNQEWMAKNLKTTKFTDGTDIPQQGIQSPAWAVYPDSLVEGINSEEEMLNAYGALYNWYTTESPHGICPQGWKIPSDDDWVDLIAVIINSSEYIYWENVGNYLKSCRQENAPDAGACATADHPRWDMHPKHHGNDRFGFAALPAGIFPTLSPYQIGEAYAGISGRWWTSTYAVSYYMLYDFGVVNRSNYNPDAFFSIRCIKE